MTLFEQIVSSILTEDVDIGKINDAINKTYEVEINYASETDSASGERIIQPVAYGLTKAGKPVIRAYQPFGDTQTTVPSWKFFLISGIQNWKPLYKNKFSTPREDFNPNGDKTMSVVYNIANFNGKTNKTITDTQLKQATNGPVKKQATNNHISVKDNPEVKKLQQLKKQLDNSRKITDIIGKPNHISVKDNPEVKKLEKLKQQLSNPRYISDVVKNSVLGNNKNTDDSKMTANSGPVEKDLYRTQTEKDIEDRRNQMNKKQMVSQDVLNQIEKEQEKKKNRNGIYRK